MDEKRIVPDAKKPPENGEAGHRKTWSKPLIKHVSVKELVRGIEARGPGDGRGKRS